jgi:hypothetical protein
MSHREDPVKPDARVWSSAFENVLSHASSRVGLRLINDRVDFDFDAVSFTACTFVEDSHGLTLLLQAMLPVDLPSLLLNNLECGVPA